MTQKIKVGATYIFRYPSVFITLPEYTKRSGQRVKVLRVVPEQDTPMWRVSDGEGWEGDVFEDELEEIPGNDYERPPARELDDVLAEVAQRYGIVIQCDSIGYWYLLDDVGAVPEMQSLLKAVQDTRAEHDMDLSAPGMHDWDGRCQRVLEDLK